MSGGGVVVAEITGCFGLKGHVRVRLHTDSADRLKGLKEVTVGFSEDDARAARIEEVSDRGTSVVVKLDSINDRTSAEQAVRKFIYCRAADAARPPAGSYFVHEIVGCGVWTEEGRFLGTVGAVQRMPAQDIWLVGGSGREQMIPAVPEFIKQVDITNRKIVVRLIDGLLEA